MKISIIIPTLNEEKNLPLVLEDIKKFFDGRQEYNYEVIIVDNCSKDGTLKIAKENNCRVLLNPIIGKGSSLKKGLEIAKGDILITMDADVSNRASEIGLLIEGIKSGYDVVFGSRFIQGGGSEDIEWYRKIGNKFFIFLVNFLWKTNYSDLCYGYQAFSREAKEKLLPHIKCQGFGIETEIAIKVAKLRLKVLEIPSVEKKRKYGKSNLKTIKDGWGILIIIVKELFFKI
ncbi:MAG: glycosyltransferase family 2 protein [Candidatus Pacebacteria bacterium]|nr:glycosyltransferase family 2 protein [Candidatus Paceibacterota bacterium]